jgi:prolyl oligopeptidase
MRENVMSFYCRILRQNLSTLLLAGVFTMSFAGSAIGQVQGGNRIALPAPPVTEKHPVTDDLHGHQVTDDYRWLEDQKSPATRAWITEENKYTDAYFSQLTDLPSVVEAIGKLEHVDSYSPVIVEGEGEAQYFFKKRLADENQGSIYLRYGWKGNDMLLIDAKKLSADQNTSVAIDDVTHDGSLLVYGIRQGGADEQEVHVYDVKTRTTLPDQLKSDRYFGVQVSPDKSGLYYSLFTHEGTVVYFHKFGTPQSDAAMIFGKEYRGEKLGELELVGASVSDNGHFLVINISRGVPATRENILLKDLRKPDSPVVPLVYGIDNHFSLLDAGDDSFYVQTDYKAPKYRILKAEIGAAPAAWETVVPESANVIQSSSIVGGRLFVDRLVDVKDETTIYSLAGEKTGELKYPGIGSGTVLYGRPRDTVGVYSFYSFNLPPTIYRYNTKTGKTDVFAQPKVPFDSAAYEVKQVFYTSKDGTRVPMFLAGKKGWKQDGKTQVLMTGYGGFLVSYTPLWNSMYAWWMEQGGLFALPNLRGGGEYGEDWHKAGMFEHKQNVFDDFFAAAQYLIDNHYTNPQQLAIWGRSNGGLLMGAAMTQRPDLFGAIVCGYPLLDMLRYQNFLFGRLWTTEYGSADNAKDYDYLAKYSPYQNVKPGIKFPAIMFFTGDSDTRVDPLHARKMTAEVQAANAGNRPILLHYSLKGGHSSGVSVDQQVQDYADIVAFLWNETTPK